MLRSADFQRVLAQVPRSRSAHFAVHHVAASPSEAGHGGRAQSNHNLSTGDAPTCPPPVDDSAAGGWWLGTVVPKRHARRAVTRNLIKRQMRAVMSEQAVALSPGMWVLRLKAAFDKNLFRSPASQALRQAARVELQILLQRAAAQNGGASRLSSGAGSA